MTIVVLDLGDIFHFFLNGAGINTHGQGVATLSSSSTESETSLLILVFFLALIGLTLMGGLSTKHVSTERISGLSPFKVFFLLFSGRDLSKIL